MVNNTPTVDDDEPKIRFDINQQLLVFIEDQPLDYLPCMSVDPEDMVTRIPHKTWIKYRGLARVNGDLYMRFMYNDVQVYVSPGFLPFLEEIPRRNVTEKRHVPKGKGRTVKQLKAKGLRRRKKPGIKVKGKRV